MVRYRDRDKGLAVWRLVCLSWGWRDGDDGVGPEWLGRNRFAFVNGGMASLVFSV